MNHHKTDHLGRACLAAVSIAAVLIGFALIGCGSRTGSDLYGNNGTPEIGVSTDTLDFGSGGLWRSLTITNAGWGTLTWMLQDVPPWISPDQFNGDLGAQLSQSLVLELNRDMLSSGLNTDSLLLTSNAGDLPIVVLAQQLDVPVLGQLPDTLDFGSNQDSLALVIVNSGAGALAYSLSLSDTLFSAFPSAGITEDQDTVWIYFNRAATLSGIQQALLTVETTSGTATVHLIAFGLNANGVWISYTGSAVDYYQAQASDYFFIVRFDQVENWPSFKISRIGIQLYTIAAVYDDIVLSCWDVTEENGILYPSQLLYETDDLDPNNGWNEWEVDWPINLGAFCVGYYQNDFSIPIYPRPYYDNTNPTGRSYIVYWDFNWNNLLIDVVEDADWCIEVFVEPISTSAGSPAPEGRWLHATRTPLPPSTNLERFHSQAARTWPLTGK